MDLPDEDLPDEDAATLPAGDSDGDDDWLLRAVARAPTAQLPSELDGTDRWRIVRRLGEGGFGVVYEVADRRTGDAAALKLLRHVRPDAVYRFKREFRALAEITHPNLVRLDALESDGAAWFYTMELVRGVDFLAFVRAAPGSLADAFAQLARGLCALHAAGKVHRDVKPSNVLVDGGGRVVLLDFGLAIDAAPGASTELAGTPLYMAPEQFLGSGPSASADWFAAGVLLYEALADRPPFEGTAAEMIDAKRRGAFEPPAARDPGTPPALAELCGRLLSPEPGARPGGDAVLAVLGAARPSAGPARDDPFVGRAQELAALDGALRASRAGPQLVLVSGEAGVGRTTLLRRFAGDAARAGALVLVGRCHERESVPYKALDGVIDELARHLRRQPAEDVDALLPPDTGDLGRVFPVLRQIAAIDRATPLQGGDPHGARRRAARALRELLGRIAERAPVVITVDDVQWGDADSAALLAELLRPPTPPAVLFAGTARRGDSGSPFLHALDDARRGVLTDVPITRLDLQPLGRDEAMDLGRRLLAGAGLDTAAAALIADESRGVPLILRELVDHARLGGSVRATLPQVVARVLDTLDPTARRLLDVIAVAGHPVTAAATRDVSDLPGNAGAALAALRSARLVRVRAELGDDLYEVTHERTRDIVLGFVAAERRRAIHLALARSLAAASDPDSESIGDHFAAAGDSRSAFEHTLAAARRASSAYAFAHAASLFRRALEVGGDATPRDGSLQVELAEALIGAGQGAAAADALLVAARSCTPDTALDLKRRAAEQLLHAGHTDRGREVLSAVLAELGLRLPRSTAEAFARFAAGAARLELTSLAPARGRAPEAPDRARQRVDALRVAVNGLAWSTPVDAAPLQTQHLLEAVALGDDERLLEALVAETIYAANATWTRRHRRARAALAELGRRLDTPRTRILTLYAEAASATVEGRWRDVLGHLGAAQEAIARHPVMEPHLIAMLVYARFNAYYWTGRVGKTAREIPAVVLELRERGNLFGWMWMSLIHAWVHCAHDRPDRARDTLARALEPWPKLGELTTMRWWYGLNESTFAAYAGDAAAATRAVEHIELGPLARQLIGSDGRTQYLWARARDAALHGDDRRLDEIAAALDREVITFAGPLALGLRAVAASLRADRGEAIRLLAAAEPAFERVDMGMMVAAARRLRGTLLGGETGAELVARSDAWMREQGVVAPARFCRMYLPGIES